MCSAHLRRRVSARLYRRCERRPSSSSSSSGSGAGSALAALPSPAPPSLSGSTSFTKSIRSFRSFTVSARPTNQADNIAPTPSRAPWAPTRVSLLHQLDTSSHFVDEYGDLLPGEGVQGAFAAGGRMRGGARPGAVRTDGRGCAGCILTFQWTIGLGLRTCSRRGGVRRGQSYTILLQLQREQCGRCATSYAETTTIRTDVCSAHGHMLQVGTGGCRQHTATQFTHNGALTMNATPDFAADSSLFMKRNMIGYGVHQQEGGGAWPAARDEGGANSTGRKTPPRVPLEITHPPANSRSQTRSSCGCLSRCLAPPAAASASLACAASGPGPAGGRWNPRRSCPLSSTPRCRTPPR